MLVADGPRRKEEVGRTGIIEGNAETLESGTKVTFPLWLANILCTRGFATVEIPPFFSESYKESLLADPTILNLQDKSDYYYELGGKLAEFLQDDSLSPALLSAFVLRFKYIVDNIDINSHHKLCRKLTYLEKRLFKAARESLKEFADWRDRKNEHITISELLVRPKKRLKINS